MRIERSIGNQISMLRALRGISLEAFADTIAIAPDRLHDIEDGRERASADLLVDIAQIFELDISYFFQLAVVPANERRT